MWHNLKGIIVINGSMKCVHVSVCLCEALLHPKLLWNESVLTSGLSLENTRGLGHRARGSQVQAWGLRLGFNKGEKNIFEPRIYYCLDPMDRELRPRPGRPCTLALDQCSVHAH